MEVNECEFLDCITVDRERAANARADDPLAASETGMAGQSPTSRSGVVTRRTKRPAGASARAAAALASTLAEDANLADLPPSDPLPEPLPNEVQGVTPSCSGTARGAVGAAGEARRAPRARQATIPADLPATADQVMDWASLSRVVTALSTCIVKAVQDGKSVTGANKKLIVLATEETRRAMAAFQRLPTTTAAATRVSPQPIEEDCLRQELVQCVREEISKLKGELISSVSKAVRPTYAQALAARAAPNATATQTGPKRATLPTTSPHASRPAIVVSTRLPVKTRQETVTAWRNSISFRDTTYAPVRVQPISKQKLRVEFETNAHRDDVLERLRGSEKVSAEPARKLSPMLLVKGITKDTPSTEIAEVIRRQNPALGALESGSEIKLRFIRKNRNEGLYNAALVVSPGVWRKAVELGRVNIDHQRVHVENFSPFMQCWACLQFGHGQGHCTSAAARPCAYCAETAHREADCPAKAAKGSPTCFNCRNRNAKFGTQGSTEHVATARSCPILLVMKARVDQRVDHGYF